MTCSQTRVTLRWIYVALLMIGFAIACAPQPQAESGNPDGVRVQHYDGQPPFNQGCLVFTHDTSQGASVAVVCK